MANSIGYPSGASPSGSVPHVWSKTLALTLDAGCETAKYFNRSFESELKEFGDTVHVNKAGTVTVSDYTIGTPITDTYFSLTDAKLILDQQKHFSVVLEDIEAATSAQNLAQLISERGMYAMSQAIDDRCLTHYADSTSTIGSTTAPINITKDNVYDYFVLANQKLAEANVTPAMMKSAVALVDPATAACIKRSPDYVKATATGDAVVRNGDIGYLGEFKVVVSNRITTVTSTKPLMFFTEDFASLAVRLNPNKIEMFRADNAFGKRLRCLALYGSKVFNAGCGLTLYKQI